MLTIFIRGFIVKQKKYCVNFIYITIQYIYLINFGGINIIDISKL